MKQMLIVALKEIKDNLRDKRSFFFAVIYGPVLMPLMLVGPLILGAKTGFIDFETTSEVKVVGKERAPNLIQHLRENNLEAVDAPDDYLELIREGKLDLVMEIPQEYAAYLREGKRAPLILYVNQSDKSSGKAARQLKTVLNSYSGQLGYWRMRARGLDPDIANVINVIEQDLSSEGFGGMIIGFFMYFIIVFTMMMGGFYLAVDSIAGERERNSLEPLLSLPLSREIILSGKYIAVYCFVILSGFLSCVSLFLLFHFLPFEQLALLIRFDLVTMMAAFLLAVPCSFLITSMLVATAAFTKSTKEAQTYISILYLLPMIPMLVGQFMDIKSTAQTMLIPFFSQYQLIDKVVKGETILAGHVYTSMAGSLLVAVILLLIAFRLYRQDKILGN